MIVRSFVKYMRIHPLLIFISLIALLTGTFVDLSIILLIVLFHEFGHYVAAYYYNWRIHSIVLWVFGAVMKTDEYGSKSIKEELMVTLAGPFQHIIIYLIIAILSFQPLLPDSIVYSIFYYNSVILLFNLLPIWPLDGGKIVFLLNSLFYPYRQAYENTIILSMFFCFGLIVLQLFLFPFNLSSLLIMIFLLIENRSDWQQRYYVFMRFLLHRYEERLNNYPFTSLKVERSLRLIDVFHKFHQGKRHLIHIIGADHNETIIVDEADCLRLYFEEKNYSQPVGELMVKHP